MNVIGSFYRDREWHLLVGQFLEGSNQLAAIPIAGIDYKAPENQQDNKGYYGAITAAVKAGLEGRLLSDEMLLGWRRLIMEEMQQKGAIKEISSEVKPEEIKSWIAEINTKLEDKNRKTEAEIITLVAVVMHTIETKNFFVPDSKRMEHLVMNYLMSYFKCPIIVFSGEERGTYLSAISSEVKMKILLAEKVRDAVFIDGVLMKRVGGKYGSEWYKAAGSTAKRDVVVQWNTLFAAQKEWQAALSPLK